MLTLAEKLMGVKRSNMTQLSKKNRLRLLSCRFWQDRQLSN